MAEPTTIPSLEALLRKQAELHVRLIDIRHDYRGAASWNIPEEYWELSQQLRAVLLEIAEGRFG
jgi:hypothetical protein